MRSATNATTNTSKSKSPSFAPGLCFGGSSHWSGGFTHSYALLRALSKIAATAEAATAPAMNFFIAM
jgi:hypothetical protein